MTGEFADRASAGRLLAMEVHRSGEDLSRGVIVGLARGGVPVAAEVAAALALPLEVTVVRKLGFPFSPEVAMGAIGEDDARVLDGDLVRQMGVTAAQVAEIEDRERAVLAARLQRYRAGRPRLDLTGRTVVIVDDGIATGATAQAACLSVRRRGASRVIVATPVCGRDAEDGVPAADRIVTLLRPSAYRAVGEHYVRFDQVPDDEVVRLLTGS